MLWWQPARGRQCARSQTGTLGSVYVRDFDPSADGLSSASAQGNSTVLRQPHRVDTTACADSGPLSR